MDRSIFRLRLPWLSAVSAPRPAPTPSPSPETTVPIQRSNTGSSAQRPPSRPPGRAPIQRPAPQSQPQPLPKTDPQSQPKTETQPAPQPPPSPKMEPKTQPQSASQPPALPKSEPPPASQSPPQPKTQAQPQPKTEPRSESQPPTQHKTEPQSASLSPTPTELQTTSRQILPPPTTAQSQPLSPPTLPSQVTSQQLLPQPATTQNSDTTEPQSSSATLTRSPSNKPTRSPSKTSTQSISPPRTASKTQPAEETTSHPQSPVRLLSPSDQQSDQTTQLSKDKRIPKFQSTIQDASQPQIPAPQQGPESVVSPQLTQESKSNAEIAAETTIKSEDQIQSESTTQPQVPEQQQKELGLLTTATTNALVAEETLKEEKTEAPLPKDSSQGIITNLLAAAADSGTKIREAASKAFQAAQKKQQEKQDVQEKKRTLNAASSDPNQLKTTTSTDITSKAQHKPLIANARGVPLQKEIMEDVSKFVNQLVAGQPNQALGEKSATVMTLAGENIGAFMQIAPASVKKEAPIHIYRGYKTNPDESPDVTTDGEGSFKGRSSEDPTTKQPLTKSYINNNVQSINNSIFLESSVDERNPGVKLSLCQNQEESTKLSPKPLETHKAEYKMGPSEKLTFEPTVRRRCLRGLFLEPSDSDTENPEKPRRHGCRFDCRKTIKDIETEYI